MGKKQNTDNYNKDYFTANGIPQAAAEHVTEDEKKELTEQVMPKPEPDVLPTGPGQDPEIARGMGQGRTRKE